MILAAILNEVIRVVKTVDSSKSLSLDAIIMLLLNNNIITIWRTMKTNLLSADHLAIKYTQL